MTHKTAPRDPFQSIAAVDLAAVSGGRLIPHPGPTQAVTQGLETLVKTIGEVGQVMTANNNQRQQQMTGYMQQFMEKRRAGG